MMCNKERFWVQERRVDTHFIVRTGTGNKDSVGLGFYILEGKKCFMGRLTTIDSNARSLIGCHNSFDIYIKGKSGLDWESIRSSPRDGFGFVGTRASC